MPYAARTIQTALYNTLRSANTTTASTDLSGSTASGQRIHDSMIRRGRPKNEPTALNQFPALFIFPEREEEAFAQMGTSAPRRQTIRFGIGIFAKPSVNPDSSANWDGAADYAEREIMTIADNARTILRADPKLSNTAALMFGRIAAADYGQKLPGAEADTHVAGLVLHYEAESLSG